MIVCVSLPAQTQTSGVMTSPDFECDDVTGAEAVPVTSL